MGKSWRRNNNYNRWNKNNKNKKSYNSNNEDGNGDKSNSYNSLDYDWKAQQDLNRYLQNYRSICLAIYTKLSSKDVSELTDNELQLLEQEVKDEVAQQQQQGRSGKGSDTGNTVRIGEHEFPFLSVETILNNEKPYIELPDTLNAKERRVVHELCLEYNLYHETIILTENNEFPESSAPVLNGRIALVISFYTDGFESLRNLDNNNAKSAVIVALQRQQQLKLYNYQSWYCQQSAEENELIEKKALESIDALIDQPGTCVRDDIDVIDYEKIENLSLSSIDPPVLDECEVIDGTSTGSSSWMLVDTLEKFNQCIQELNEAFYGTESSQPRATELAFDLECVNQSKYTQLTCLLQITTNIGKEYIIDPLSSNELFKEINQLSKFFEDPNIVKIGHSVGGLDCKCLHRDFGIVVVNLFDTYECAQLLHLPSFGLATICEYYGLSGKYYQQIKDVYQKCDWTIRPLSKQQIQYGRYDVHYLIMLRTLMIRDLTQNEFYYKDTMVFKQRQENDVNIARSLAITLQQFEDAENNDDLDFNEMTPMTNETPVVETDVTTTPNGSTNQDDVICHGNNQSVTFNNDVQAYVNSESSDNQTYETPLKDSIKFQYDRQNSNTSTENGITFMTPATSFDEYDTRPTTTPYINGDINARNDSSNNDNTVDVYATPLNIPSTVKKSNVTTKRKDHQSNTDGGDSKQTIATAADLRLHARYMTVISISQERCKDIWKISNGAEPYLQNQSFMSMIHRAKLMTKKSVSSASTSSNENSTDTNDLSIWTARSTELYHELVQWRNTLASEDLQCLPGFIVSINFLVAVAWKWPSTENQLRLIQYILPPLLEDSERYRDQLLNIVNTKRKVSKSNSEDETSTEVGDATIIEYRYSTISVGLAKIKNSQKESLQSKVNDTSRTIDVTTTKPSWVTAAVVVTVVAVVTGTAIILLKRRRR